MKSKYFQSSGFSKDGIKSLNLFAGLKSKTINQLLDWLDSTKSYPKMYDEQLIELSKLTQLSGSDTSDSIAVLMHFIDVIIENDDDINIFYEDLKEHKLIEEKIGYKGLDIVFSRLPKIIDKFTFFHRKSQTKSMGNPNLSGSSMTSAIRPVYRKKFEYGKDNIKIYDPEPLGYCVVAEIELKKSDNAELFGFHMDSDTLNRFVTDLLALQQEMKKMTKNIEFLPKN